MARIGEKEAKQSGVSSDTRSSEFQRRVIFGQNLRRLRMNKGWRQIDLAAKIGSGQVTISSWEICQSIPDDEMLERLAEALGCTVADLYRPDAAFVQFETRE